ncbi:MAG: hypothetical protein ACTSXH_14375 [Promethearchaeota archaeon]
MNTCLIRKHVAFYVPDIGATSYYAENYTIIDATRLENVPIGHNGYSENFLDFTCLKLLNR